MKRLFFALALLLPFCAIPQSFATSPGENLQLLAMTAGPAVTWSVQETGGGAVNASGVYTAPACSAFTWPQTFHVTASAGGVVTTYAVVVNDAVATVTISPSAPTVAPGGTVQFTATVTTVCGVVSH